MSIDIKSRFTVGECPGAPGHWYVDWTELGPVEKETAKHKLCEIVFDRIRPKWRIGVGYNVKFYRPSNPAMLRPPTTLCNPAEPVPNEVFSIVEDSRWEVQWISYEGWQQLQEYQYDAYGRLLFRANDPNRQYSTGIVLESLDQAEQFVDLMEAQFTFYALKKNYNYEEW